MSQVNKQMRIEQQFLCPLCKWGINLGWILATNFKYGHQFSVVMNRLPNAALLSIALNGQLVDMESAALLNLQHLRHAWDLLLAHP